MNTAEIAGQEDVATKESRNPKAPRHGLSTVLKYLEKLHKEIGKSTVNPDMACKALGFSGPNGAALTMLATLSQYGLIARKKGAVSITPLSLRIMHPISESHRLQSLRDAALSSSIIKDIHDKWHDCSEQTIKNHLIHTGFSEEGAARAASVYVENKQFANLQVSQSDSQPDSPTLGGSPQPETPIVSPNAEGTRLSSLQQNAVSAQGARGELPIPIAEGLIARIPFPMDEDAFDILIGTLNLWKKRIVKAPPTPGPDNQ